MQREGFELGFDSPRSSSGQGLLLSLSQLEGANPLLTFSAWYDIGITIYILGDTYRDDNPPFFLSL